MYAYTYTCLYIKEFPLAVQVKPHPDWLCSPGSTLQMERPGEKLAPNQGQSTATLFSVARNE